MFRTLPVALCAVLLVSGCGSRYNPMNWFEGGSSGPADAVATSDADMAEIMAEATAQPLVAGLTSVKAEPIPGGLILRAVGVSAVSNTTARNWSLCPRMRLA